MFADKDSRGLFSVQDMTELEVLALQAAAIYMAENQIRETPQRNFLRRVARAIDDQQSNEPVAIQQRRVVENEYEKAKQ